jgi:hypothetical protein
MEGGSDVVGSEDYANEYRYFGYAGSAVNEF